jgi:2-polyprenyl-3-methyl-5-hydroxy-6-metoxy-1,4-benzoquinol methylase
VTAADNWRELNLANWNDRVPVHLASEFYGIEEFRTRQDSLPEFEVAEVGDVAGKTLLHLQCHIGLDTLSWARRGATVTGLDFSAPAIDAARDLAASTGLAAEFLTADVYEAGAALAGRSFDIVYTGIGALCWLPDMPAWARVAASLVSPGGFLYLADGHPFMQILDYPTGATVETDYFDTAGQVRDFTHSYTDGTTELEHTTSVQFQHPIGEIVTALIDAGLRIEFLHEQDFALWEAIRWLRRSSDGSFGFPDGRPRVPLMFSLRAAKPS